MIYTEGLTKRYGDILAVDHIDLRIDAGTVYGFLGPNGAGKTTTMQLLTTLETPTEGHATVAGHPTTDREAVKPHIGYLPDTPPVYDAFTGYEQLEYVATLRGLDDEVASGRIDRLLARVGLSEAANRRIDTYSQGMRQKVGLIQSVLHEPGVLFLDEPTNGLDPRAAREVVDLINELSETGTTIFLSTHILPVVEELANTVGVLHDGTLLTEGTPAELVQRATSDEDQSLEQAFLEITADDAHLSGETDPSLDTRP